jgi:hypothetical protein
VLQINQRLRWTCCVVWWIAKKGRAVYSGLHPRGVLRLRCSADTIKKCFRSEQRPFYVPFRFCLFFQFLFSFLFRSVSLHISVPHPFLSACRLLFKFHWVYGRLPVSPDEYRAVNHEAFNHKKYVVQAQSGGAGAGTGVAESGTTELSRSCKGKKIPQ